MDPQILTTLIGAGVGGLIAIVAGIVGAIIQYRLSIRLEKMRFEQQKELAQEEGKRQERIAREQMDMEKMRLAVETSARARYQPDQKP